MRFLPEVNSSTTLASVTAVALRSRRAQFGMDAAQRGLLAKAFRGELVPQDPNDEPAAVLLERIRAARAAEPEKPRRGRGTKPAPPRPAAPPPNGSTTHVGRDDSLDLIVAALQQGEPRLTASAIAATTGLAAAVVRQALKDLVAAGQVRVHGKARGTSYEWMA